MYKTQVYYILLLLLLYYVMYVHNIIIHIDIVL